MSAICCLLCLQYILNNNHLSGPNFKNKYVIFATNLEYNNTQQRKLITNNLYFFLISVRTMIFLLSALHVQKNNKNYKTQKPAGLVFYKTGFFEPSLSIMQCNCKMSVLTAKTF